MKPQARLARSAPSPAQAGPLGLVLARVRLRAQLRVAWLRAIWRDQLPQGATNEAAAEVVSHAEVDLLLEGRDDPAQEAAWLAAQPTLAEIRGTLAEIERALEVEDDSRLVRLAKVFALEPLEIDLLQTCAALAIDPQLGRVFAYLHDDVRRAHVTEGLVARLFGHGRANLLGPEAAVRRWDLVHEREVAPGEPRLYECDPAVRAFLLGRDELDAELLGVVRVVPPLPPLSNWPVGPCAAILSRLLDGPTPAPVRLQIAGPLGSGRRTFAAALAARLGLSVLAIDVSGVDALDWSRLCRRAQRRAWLDRCALLWHGEGVSRRSWPADPPVFPLQFVLTESRDLLAPIERTLDRLVELPAPSLEDRFSAWRALVPASAAWAPERLERLVTHHRTNIGQIAAAARLRLEGPEEAEALLREAGRRQLGDLAQRLDTTFDWDDLVVPAALKAALADFVFEANERVAFWERPEAQRLFPQGRGLLALLSGRPGTGKTMAAQVVARALGLDLYRIDLSTVVSKWVGETSRNLEAVLSAAAGLDLVLLFDEADALFGERTEVKDAHDRYANTDTSHLLQAIESYRGVALLASNRRGDIDVAFTRRLRYVFDFPAPDAQLRRQLWTRLLGELAGPQTACALATDLSDLADSLEMSGSQIKYAVLSSLFAARQEGASVQMGHVVRGVERELLKEGRGLSARLSERWPRRG